MEENDFHSASEVQKTFWDSAIHSQENHFKGEGSQN
jgi:hypothetical protein